MRTLIQPNASFFCIGVCSDGGVDLDYFDKLYCQNGAEVLNKDDEFETVEQAISLEQLWIPGIFDAPPIGVD